MKYTTRGDAHKLYLRLRQMPAADMKKSRYLKETAEIKKFYQSLESDTLRLIYYQVVKEKGGIGIIPILTSSVPWLLLFFAKPLEEVLFRQGNSNWIIFALIYLILITISLVLHFKENAWAVVHTEIIRDILEERE